MYLYVQPMYGGIFRAIPGPANLGNASGISIFRSLKGNENWFETSGGSGNG